MRILSRISARLAVASLAAFLATSTFVACSGEDGKDGAVGATGAEGPKGKDAKVNVDSIANAKRWQAPSGTAFTPNPMWTPSTRFYSTTLSVRHGWIPRVRRLSTA